MAIKIFCNQCREFIKDATPSEAGKLTGEEICVDCREKKKAVLDELETFKRQATKALTDEAMKWQVKLDDLVRKAVK